MRLATPTLEQCELVRQWRNAPDILPMLRTKEPLTAEQQAAFYRDVVCNPKANHRYYALVHHGQFVGLGGLTYLDRAPGEGEISLILGPEFRSAGLGAEAVQALRAEGGKIGLRWVIGECYNVNPATDFWVKQVVRCDGSVTYLSDRILFRMRAIPV